MGNFYLRTFIINVSILQLAYILCFDKSVKLFAGFSDFVELSECQSFVRAITELQI